MPSDNLSESILCKLHVDEQKVVDTGTTSRDEVKPLLLPRLRDLSIADAQIAECLVRLVFSW